MCMPHSKTTVGLSLEPEDKDILLRYCSQRTISSFVSRLLREHHKNVMYGDKTHERRLERMEEKLNEILDKLTM